MPLEGNFKNSIKIGKRKLTLPKNWYYFDRSSGSIWITKRDPKTEKEVAGYKSAEGFKGDIISGCGEKRCSSILTPNGVTKEWTTFDWWGRLTCMAHATETFEKSQGKVTTRKSKGIKKYNSCLKGYGIEKLENPSELFFGTENQMIKNHKKIINYING